MVKLPISDYVADYYKEQGITFTFRQQAHFCWFYQDLLEDRLNSISDILKISDDEKLNTEIRERIAYEEKAHECFMTGQEGCIYIVRPDGRKEYDETEYFLSAERAVSYGIRHCDNGFEVIKSWLFDRNPEGLSEETEGDEPGNVNEILSWYSFTPEGDILYGGSYEYMEPFDEEDYDRFENMFLCIKSPFGLGDIVMGPDLERPQVVSTDHDCFMEHYDRQKAFGYTVFEGFENIIRTDLVNADGSLDYAHTVPFALWKVDSWEDKEYWELLQIMSHAVKNGVELYDFNILCRKYGERNEKCAENDGRV